MGSSFLKEQFLKVIREDKDEDLIYILNNNTQSNQSLYTPDKYINENKDFTALNIAASFGSIKVADILLKKGWNIEVPEKINGNSSLLLACKFGYLEMVKMFIENKANIFYENNMKMNCLDIAVLFGHYSIANYLYVKGIKIKTLKEYKLLIKVPSFDMSLFYSSLINGILPQNAPSFALKKNTKGNDTIILDKEQLKSNSHINKQAKMNNQKEMKTENNYDEDMMVLSSRYISSKIPINKSELNCQDVSISIQTIKIEHSI